MKGAQLKKSSRYPKKAERFPRTPLAFLSLMPESRFLQRNHGKDIAIHFTRLI